MWPLAYKNRNPTVPSHCWGSNGRRTKAMDGPDQAVHDGQNQSMRRLDSQQEVVEL